MKRLAILIVLCASTAAADNKADALFKKGKKQLAEKRYPEACATFEKVDAIDPGIGAKLNVAKCYQDWGKLARAYKWYVDAEHMAKDGGDKRAAKIRELIDKLDGDVPRLTIKPIGGAGDPGVTLDGDKLAVSSLGKETRVDPGPHEIAYEVDGAKKSKTIAIERGGAREVTIELGKPDKPDKPDKGDKRDKGDKGDKQDKVAKWRSPKPDKPEPSTTPDKPGLDDQRTVKRDEPAPPGRTRRIAGIAIAGAGVVGLGVASIVTLRARGDYKDALAAHCMGQTNLCDDEGLKATHDARSTANIATVISLVGLAAIAGGAVLYFTAPTTERRADSQAMYVAPILGPDGGGLVVGGRY